MALFSGKKAECFRVFFVKDLIMSGIHKTSINYFHGAVVFTKLNLMFQIFFEQLKASPYFFSTFKSC